MDEISATAGLYFPEICEDFGTDVVQNPSKEEEEELSKSNWMVVSVPTRNKLTLKTERINSV